MIMRLSPGPLIDLHLIVQTNRTKYKHTHLTSISMSSCRFLQVAASVSDVPNSKYHSLFFIL